MRAGRPIRVMTIDDSPTIRRLIATALAPHPDLLCLDGGAHPFEARDRIRTQAPDVLILDIEMPQMNGLDFLRRMMVLRPMPVLMFSSLTAAGCRRAIEALELGAVDVLAKTRNMVCDGTLEKLPDRIRAVAQARVPPRGASGRHPADPIPPFRNRNGIVMIGASTGGVDALERVLAQFPPNCPPTMVTQHMPAAFLRKFAARLDQIVPPRAKLAEAGEVLRDGVIYIAPGGAHHLALAPDNPCRCVLDPCARVSGHRPSVDVMFRSGLAVAPRIVAVLLTGMGTDGAAGMAALRAAGARTLAQDAASSTVYGMPRAAMDCDAAERAVALADIAGSVLALCGQGGRTGP